MINIFVEANCNRYTRDECQYCHVYEPLSKLSKSDWHLLPEQARIMVDKIRQMEIFTELAKREINLTGGEPSQNPHIVEIFKIFRNLTPNVRLHTNLDISSNQSQRWLRLVEIMKLAGRVDFTLYPTVWESRQKPLLEEILQLQDELIVNVIFETVADLLIQVEILKIFLKLKGRGSVPSGICWKITEPRLIVYCKRSRNAMNLISPRLWRGLIIISSPMGSRSRSI